MARVWDSSVVFPRGLFAKPLRCLVIGFAGCAAVVLALPTALGQPRATPSRPAISKTTAAPIQMVDVPEGTFIMGRRDDGDDEKYGLAQELPRHAVTLSAYKIGKYKVTNGQYCDVLNLALARGYLEAQNGSPYTVGDVCKNGKILLGITATGEYQFCLINYASGVFSWKWRMGEGIFPYSMQNHPVVNVSWYGAVAFCNWLSEKEGLTPCYNLSTWELIDADGSAEGIQFHGGYRLPTEAEWERAAAWDPDAAGGPKHWIYGFMDDTLTSPTGRTRCNYKQVPLGDIVNPLGLVSVPFTSPVGWFNGVNISPNGNIQTVDSHSPVGAYDMAGNVREWCYDWIQTDYFALGPMQNPTGPTTGTYRVSHAGSFNTEGQDTRVSQRDGDLPTDTYYHNGFRVCRSLPPTSAKSWREYR